MDSLFADLALIFPNSEITITSEILEILNSNLSHEAKVLTILSNYFNKEREKYTSSHSLENIIRIQARHIHKLFPSTDFNYIIQQLNVYKDMPNRAIIVLRQLVYLNETNQKPAIMKRELPESNLDNLNNNVPAQKIRRVSCTITRPSSSSSSAIDVPIQSSKPSTSKMETSSLERSTATSFQDTPLPEEHQRELPVDAPTQSVTSSTNKDNDRELNRAQFDIRDFMNDFEVPPLNIVTSSELTEPVEAVRTPSNTESGDNEITNGPSEPEKEHDSPSTDQTEIYYSLDDHVDMPEPSPISSYPVRMMSPTFMKLKANFIKGLPRDPHETDYKVETDDCVPISLNEPSTSKNNISYKDVTPNAVIQRILSIKTRSKMDIKPISPVLVFDSDSDVEECQPIGNVGKKKIADCNKKQAPTVPEDHLDIQLVNTLCNIFPEACPKYIRILCRGKMMTDEVVDGLINEILDADGAYPKRPKPPPEPEFIPENQLELLRELLPDADPDYLSMMCDKFDGKPEQVRAFVNEAMETKNYPTMKEYLRRQQLSAQQKQYTTEFNVENFVKIIPNPSAFFSDPSRNLTLSASECHYALVFMRNKFNKLPIRTIQSTFTKHKNNVSATLQELEANSAISLKSSRKPIKMPANIENIPLLQEIAYYSHKDKINKYLIEQEKKRQEERFEAKKQGILKSCNCCFDEEVLPKDILRCENGCEFCKDCVVKSSEVHFGMGKLEFPCLMNCSAAFSLQTLQMALSPKLFSKVAQKKALEEIKSAGIEELETCPFCDFATIIPEGYNIFTCMNPECMKESCRMCKEPSHIPLRCDEIEKDEDVKARVFVENKMTEALLRKCWKCGIKFFKEEGCNKMTCSCGALQCYVCGKPVTDYQHFNGNGGDRYDLCPLYSDTNVLNKENVLKGAAAAKAELGNQSLKYDPTTDVNEHYQQRRRMFPQDHLLVGQVRPPQLPPHRLPQPMVFMGAQMVPPRNVPRHPHHVTPRRRR